MEIHLAGQRYGLPGPTGVGAAHEPERIGKVGTRPGVTAGQQIGAVRGESHQVVLRHPPALGLSGTQIDLYQSAVRPQQQCPIVQDRTVHMVDRGYQRQGILDICRWQCPLELRATS